MKTTVELPDDLMRAVKTRAVREDRKLKDMLADLLRRGLADESDDVPGAPNRVRLPLIMCARPADPDDEMTPDRAAEILLADEAPSPAGSEIPTRRTPAVAFDRDDSGARP